MTERTLDWRPRFDEASRNFPVRSLFSAPVNRRTRLWREGTVLDQGREGACVGFGKTGYLLTSPLGRRPQAEQGNRFALSIYKEAQKIDEWPGEEYSGTSVLAGAKVIQSRGYISAYRWAFGIDDVIDALVTTGPVVIGIPWLEGMYETRPSGLVEVHGPQVGGHCILLTGYVRSISIEGKREEVVRWRNSWGREYGINGSAFIKVSDLADLLKQNGEACIPTGKKQLVLA